MCFICFLFVLGELHTLLNVSMHLLAIQQQQPPTLGQLQQTPGWHQAVNAVPPPVSAQDGQVAQTTEPQPQTSAEGTFDPVQTSWGGYQQQQPPREAAANQQQQPPHSGQLQQTPAWHQAVNMVPPPVPAQEEQVAQTTESQPSGWQQQSTTQGWSRMCGGSQPRWQHQQQQRWPNRTREQWGDNSWQ